MKFKKGDMVGYIKGGDGNTSFFGYNIVGEIICFLPRNKPCHEIILKNGFTLKRHTVDISKRYNRYLIKTLVSENIKNKYGTPNENEIRRVKNL